VCVCVCACACARVRVRVCVRVCVRVRVRVRVCVGCARKLPLFDVVVQRCVASQKVRFVVSKLNMTCGCILKTVNFICILDAVKWYFWL